MLFAYGVGAFGETLGTGWLHGLKVAAVAVVAQAVLAMMRTLAPDKERATLAIIAAGLVSAFPTAWGQIGAILLGGLAGVTLLRTQAPTDHVAMPHAVTKTAAVITIFLFFALLIGVPLLLTVMPSHSLQVFEAFYRAGSLVFGGGHVVLPLLQVNQALL